MAKGAYIGIDGVARKVKGGYIGIKQELPSGYTSIEYIESSGTQYIDTGFNPNNKTRVVVDVTPSATGMVFGIYAYYYLTCIVSSDYVSYTPYIGQGSGISIQTDLNQRALIDFSKNALIVNGESKTFSTGTPQPNTPIYLFAQNYGGGSSATSLITAKLYSCKIYDNLTLVRDFVPCTNSSGTVGLYDLVNNVFYTNKGTGAFTAGPQQIKELARKIKNAYIGIGGVARPCWPSPDPVSYGTITSLTYAVQGLAATSVGDYALFGGGNTHSSEVGGTYRKTINVYNSSLVKQSDLNLKYGTRGLCAGSIASYAIFVGGNTSGTRTPTVFNSSLSSVSSMTALSTDVDFLATATVGNYIIFAGGHKISGTQRNNANYQAYAYNSSLVKQTANNLSYSRGQLAATTVGNYALFAGGRSGEGSLYSDDPAKDNVESYDSSLTYYSSRPSLSVARYGLAATTVGDYAIFAGGRNESLLTSVDVYSSSLTKVSSVASLSYYNADGLGATTLGDFALFGGNHGLTAENCSPIIDCYDKYLTKTSKLNLSSSRYWLAATTVGNYALFGGGFNYVDSTGTPFKTVDAYTII